MLYYDDGQPIQLYDIVDCDGDLTRIDEIVETADQLAGWGLDEPAVFFTSIANPSLGQYMVDRSSSTWDKILLIRRAATQG